MDPGAVYRALSRSGEFDVGVVFATDGRVSASELAILRDDLSFFPSYLLAPVVRKSTWLGRQWDVVLTPPALQKPAATTVATPDTEMPCGLVELL